MSGKKRVVNENVEVEVVTEVTEKKGLLTQFAEGAKSVGNWCRRHWKGLAISTATIGAGLYLGAKCAEEDDEDEVYLIEVETELEDVEDISEDDESEEDDDNEETEENDDEETED